MYEDQAEKKHTNTKQQTYLEKSLYMLLLNPIKRKIIPHQEN